MQLEHLVDPDILFRNYAYIPSLSADYVAHFRAFADDCVDGYALNDKTVVMDIGSNDGTLLSFFVERGIPVLGIDPAENIALIARAKHIPTETVYFGKDTAGPLQSTYGSATLVTAFNTFGHIPDLIDFCEGLKSILAENGVFIAQFPYVADLLEHVEFDTIYHEHCSYFSVQSLTKLFDATDLELIDVARQPIHGGSLRITVAHKGKKNVSANVTELLQYEKDRALDTSAPFNAFALAVTARKEALRTLITTIRQSGSSIAAFGMPAKGNILLNVCGLNNDDIDFIVDSTPFKQGKYSPVSRIPVVAEEELYRRKPDFLLVLAWNFFEEIQKKHARFSEGGGKFIVPMPVLRITT